MGKTFTDLKGTRYRVENCNGVDYDQDMFQMNLRTTMSVMMESR